LSTNNEPHRYAVLSSLRLLPPSYAQISPSAPYELSKTLGLCYFLNMRDQVSHSHTKTSTIVVLRMYTQIANGKQSILARMVAELYRVVKAMTECLTYQRQILTDCNWYHSCHLKTLHMTSQCGWCCRVTSWILSGERNW
jgi:hypothetical protein